MKRRDEPEVPATISDEQMNDLRRRGQWATRNEKFTDPKAVARRISAREQHQKRRLS